MTFQCCDSGTFLTVDPGDGDALEGGDEDDDTRPGVIIKHLEHEHSSLKYKLKQLQQGSFQCKIFPKIIASVRWSWGPQTRQ